MEKYKTLEELHKAVKSGEIDESKMEVFMDNDYSRVYYGPYTDSDGKEIDNCIFRGKGYNDVQDLWPLVFPKANVDWC